MPFAKGATVSPQEARRIMMQSEPHVLLDVRTPAEYRQIRIDGAQLLPVDEIRTRAADLLPEKHIAILVYCQSGMRASRAVKTLNQMGYTNVVSFGGIMSWPYGTVKG